MCPKARTPLRQNTVSARRRADVGIAVEPLSQPSRECAVIRVPPYTASNSILNP